MKRWYLFDRYDCFAVYDSIIDAAERAETLALVDKLEGVEIKYLSDDEWNAYMAGGEKTLHEFWDKRS